MPVHDSRGRLLSEDGVYFWDGSVWQIASPRVSLVVPPRTVAVARPQHTVRYWVGLVCLITVGLLIVADGGVSVSFVCVCLLVLVYLFRYRLSKRGKVRGLHPAPSRTRRQSNAGDSFVAYVAMQQQTSPDVMESYLRQNANRSKSENQLVADVNDPDLASDHRKHAEEELNRRAQQQQNDHHEQERRQREDQERRQRDEQDRRTRDEQDRRQRDEQDRRNRDEQDRRNREDQDRRNREDQDRRNREEQDPHSR